MIKGIRIINGMEVNTSSFDKCEKVKIRATNKQEVIEECIEDIKCVQYKWGHTLFNESIKEMMSRDED